jgi:hypothetical protein
MNTNRFFVRLNSIVAILALMFYLSGIAMAQSPQGQKPADKTPPPEWDTFGDDGTPTFEDMPTPTFQPRPLGPAKQDDKEKETKEKKGKKEKGDGVVQIQSALPDLKFGSVVVTPDGDVAGGSGVTGQAATITVTILNGGSGTAGAFRLDVWKHLPSPPNFGSIGDFSQTFSGLAGNTSLTVSYSFTMANSYGTYFPRSTVDSGSSVVETSEANNTNTGSYTVIEMATVVPPTLSTVVGSTVVFRGVAKPYGKKWPVGQPTALITVPGVGTVAVPNTGTATLAGVGTFGPLVNNLIGDASLTCALEPQFVGTATLTFICGTSTASGELRSVCVGSITPTDANVSSGKSITFTVQTNPASVSWPSGFPTATLSSSSAGTLSVDTKGIGVASVTLYTHGTFTGYATVTFQSGSCSASAMAVISKLEIEIANTVSENDDFIVLKNSSFQSVATTLIVPTGHENVVTAKVRLVGPSGHSTTVTFATNSYATVAPNSLFMTVGNDYSLTITGVVHTPSENSAEVIGFVGSITYEREDFTVYEFDQDKELWWFGGEDPELDHYPVQSTLIVRGLGAVGEFQWEITAGVSVADLVNDSQGTSSLTVNGDPTVQLKSKDGSAGAAVVTPDIAIDFRRNGILIAQLQANAFKPDRLIPNQTNHGAAGNGYVTTISYLIVDQFNRLPIQGGLVANEDIDGNGQPSNAQQVSAAATSVYKQPQKPCNEDWPWGQETDLPVFGFILIDSIGRAGTPPHNCPVPQNPPNPVGNELVDHSPQGAIYVGSRVPGKGVKVRDVTWRVFQDHGSH